MSRPNLYENPLNAVATSNPTILDKTQGLKKHYVTIVATLCAFVLYSFAAFALSYAGIKAY
jgi:hypothetical protein